MKLVWLAVFGAACASHHDDVAPDASDASDARCATQARPMTSHAHALAQPTPLGRTLADVRGWHGQLYFGYGDLELNTGPIAIDSFDPIANAWTTHPIGYRDPTTSTQMTTDAFATHVIERYLPIGDQLWAPAGQPDFTPLGAAAAPEYAIASATHDWAEVDIAPDSIHVIDAIERVPGEILVTGSGLFHDRGTQPDGPLLAGGYVWRSIDGGPFAQIFPVFGEDQFHDNVDRSGAWIFGAALHGIAYLDEASFIYTADPSGVSCCTAPAFGQFLRPVTFADHIVFADLGQLWTFDARRR